MKYKAILFDLDGTLLPQDQEIFVGAYFKSIAAKLAGYGYPPEQLVKTVWKGTAEMLSNDGSMTNEEAFLKVFLGAFGKEAKKDLPLFDEYYESEFMQLRSVCGFDEDVPSTVRALKECGYRLIVATNPIFPRVAVKARLSWAGLDIDCFEYCTTYENSTYCKPSVNYYQEILQRLSLKAEECLMVGNDVSDDMVVDKIGMDRFLIPRCLINKSEADISDIPQGDFKDLYNFVNLA